MALRCLLLVELDASPSLNPLEMVFTIVFLVSSRRAGLLSLDRSLLVFLFLISLGLLSLHRGLLSLGLRSSHRPYCRPFATYRWSCPAWINSSILSLRTAHSLVVWLWHRWYRQYLLRSPCWGDTHLSDSLMRSVFRASSRIRARPVLSGVYLVNLWVLGTSLNLGGLACQSPRLPWLCSPLKNCRSSSTCMNWMALRRRLSMLAWGYIARLSANSSGLSAVIKYAIATSGRSPRMLRVTWPNLAMNAFRDSSFSCWMLTNATDVIWCGLLVANWATNLAFKVINKSIDPGGRRVNQLSAASRREVRKTLQYI